MRSVLLAATLLRRTLRRGTYRVAITLRDARGAKRTLTKSLKVRR